MKIYFSLALLCVFFWQTAFAESSNLWIEQNTATKQADLNSSSTRRYFKADEVQLRQILSRAGMEGRGSADSQIELPLANGQISQFLIEESPVMAPGLAARYPSIKTYRIISIDNPASTGRLSMSPKGLYAMINQSTGTYFIDAGSDGKYSVYRKKNLSTNKPFQCDVEGGSQETSSSYVAGHSAYRTAGSLRVYRLALAATSEYIDAVGGTAEKVMEEMAIAINRVNQIYQRDLAIKLELVDNNDALLEGLANLPKAYSNQDASLLLDENQQNIDTIIGTQNYDIGHVFSTGAGGLAEVGSVCTSLKAGGATGLYDPTGEAFYIDYVAHEMGHQFGAEHSFNGTTLNCVSPNRWGPSAFEPGGGSTIMSYAGICGAENIVSHADAMFHAGSIEQIDAYTTSGTGASCGTVLAINNPAEPTAEAGSDYVIPVATPFVLRGSGTDADGDGLSYSWEEMDAGTATNSSTLGTDLGDNALMRSYLPRTSAIRYLPDLQDVLTQSNDGKSEVLPTTDREMNFRLSVRDGRSGMGQDDVKISSTTAAGPFLLTSHDTSVNLSGGDTQTVSWNVAGTDSPPVNCSQVDIALLMMNNARTTYCSQDLLVGAVNNGSAQITLPDLNIPKVHIRVSCSDNIFYAVSTGNMSVIGNAAADVSCKTVIPATEEHSDIVITVDDSKVSTPDPTVPNVSTPSSGGSFSLYGLMSLFLVFLLNTAVRVRKSKILQL